MNRSQFRFLILLCLIVPLFSFGQKEIVSGYVKDKNNNPLSYVNIVSCQYKIGTSTNDSGFFSIGFDKSDTVKFSHISFYSRVVPVNNILKDSVVVLEDREFSLDGVVVKPKNSYKQKEKIGFASVDKSGSFSLGPGNQLAIFIDNYRKKAAYIESVSFYVKDKGKCNSKIRIRILEKEKNKFAPGKDLLTENYVIRNKDLLHRNTINISKSNLFLPEEGVFVVIEWVGVDDNCIDKSYPIITANLRARENYLWYNYRDKEWSRAPRPVMNENFMTPNVFLTVYF